MWNIYGIHDVHHTYFKTLNKSFTLHNTFGNFIVCSNKSALIFNTWKRYSQDKLKPEDFSLWIYIILEMTCQGTKHEVYLVNTTPQRKHVHQAKCSQLNQLEALALWTTRPHQHQPQQTVEKTAIFLYTTSHLL